MVLAPEPHAGGLAGPGLGDDLYLQRVAEAHIRGRRRFQEKVLATPGLQEGPTSFVACAQAGGEHAALCQARGEEGAVGEERHGQTAGKGDRAGLRDALFKGKPVNGHDRALCDAKGAFTQALADAAGARQGGAKRRRNPCPG